MMNREQDLRTTLDELSKRATPGPWAAESEKSEGSYGSGEDTHEGYDTAIIVTEAETRYSKAGVLFESHNSTVGSIAEEHDDDWFRAWDEVSKANAKFIVALVNAYRSGKLAAPPRPDHAVGVEAAAAEYDRWGTGYNSRRVPGRTSWVGRKNDDGSWHEVSAHGSENEAASECHARALAAAIMAASPAQAPDKAAEREGLTDALVDALALPHAGDRERIASVIEKRWDALVGPAAGSGIGLSRRTMCQEFAAALAPKPTGTEAGRGVGAGKRSRLPGPAEYLAQSANPTPPLSPDSTGQEREAGLSRATSPIPGDMAQTAHPEPDSTAQGDGTSQEGGR